MEYTNQRRKERRENIGGFFMGLGGMSPIDVEEYYKKQDAANNSIKALAAIKAAKGDFQTREPIRQTQQTLSQIDRGNIPEPTQQGLSMPIPQEQLREREAESRLGKMSDYDIYSKHGIDSEYSEFPEVQNFTKMRNNENAKIELEELINKNGLSDNIRAQLAQWASKYTTPENALDQMNSGQNYNEQVGLEGVRQKNKIQMEYLDLQGKKDFEDYKKSIEKEKPVSGEVGKQLGHLATAAKGMYGFLNELDNGDVSLWQVTPAGKFINPRAKMAIEMAGESLVRMASGAAIKDEERDFYKNIFTDPALLSSEKGRQTIKDNGKFLLNRAFKQGEVVTGKNDWYNGWRIDSAKRYIEERENEGYQRQDTRSFRNEQEAESSNLPKGTIVIINGRKAVIE